MLVLAKVMGLFKRANMSLDGAKIKANLRCCESDEMTPNISDSRERHDLLWEDWFQTPPPCPEYADAVTAMQHRLRSLEGEAMYAKCKSTRVVRS